MTLSKTGNLKIALTGGIASGKSTVSKFLNEKGYPVIDADKLSRDLTSYPSGKALPKIKEEFGQGVFEDNGEFSRSRMRKLIFKEPQARKKLESILHPMISELSLKMISDFHSKGNRVVFYDAALIIESNRQSEFDGLLLVSCSVENQIKRLMQRDNISEKDAKHVLNSQLSFDQKKPFATWILVNDNSLEELEHQLDVVLTELEKR